ncbi:hypothetical protein LIER_27785 [Lithospermum erythrorhizon]|uniref:Uncharacterized protein n=1 Tax=Lithospermum erythrorhizon TaxID=34254 RepID=A0AAV3RDL7_LITER
MQSPKIQKDAQRLTGRIAAWTQFISRAGPEASVIHQQSHERGRNKLSHDEEAGVRSYSGRSKTQTLLRGSSGRGYHGPSPTSNSGEPQPVRTDRQVRHRAE